MGIRAFDSYLRERGLVQEAPLSALSGTRLGIDASHYLKTLLADSNESFLPAIGGSPLTLFAQINRDCQTMQSLSIKPVFAFTGMQPKDRERPFASVDDPRLWRRMAAWEHYEQGRVEQAQVDFAASQSYQPHEVMRVALRILKQRHTELVVAPYLAWAQLVYLQRHEKSYIHSIYGSSESLLFEGVDKIILGVDFSAQKFSFVSKAAILADLAVTADQFLDIAIFAGFDNVAYFPAFNIPDFHFRQAVDLIKRGGPMNAIMGFVPALAVGYADLHARARAMIKFSLVLVAGEGRVLPLPSALPPPPQPKGTPASMQAPLALTEIPQDLSDIFSLRLPDELYYQFFRGLVGPTVISALASGYWLEAPPLCGGTPEYQSFVKSLSEQPNSPRSVALALISSVLHPMWSKKTVAAVYYFDPSRDYPIPHNSPVTLTFIETVSKWNVDARHVEDELRRQASSTIDFYLCLGGTSTASLAQRTYSTKNPDRLLDKKDEIVANALWRFLELRHLLTSSHHHTSSAHALYLAMKSSKVNDKFQESLFLAMELLRMNVLHNGRLGGRVWSGGPSIQGSEEDHRAMLLAMRTFSLVSVTFNNTAWTSPLSREMLVFNSFVRMLSRSLRALVEAVTMNLLLRNDAQRAREDYIEISLSLPFAMEINTGLGVIVKAYIELVCHIAGGLDVVKRAGLPTATPEEREEVAQAKEMTVQALQEGFPNVKDVKTELERGMRFWRLVMVIVDTLASNTKERTITTELAAQFAAADRFLQPFALS